MYNFHTILNEDQVSLIAPVKLVIFLTVCVHHGHDPKIATIEEIHTLFHRRAYAYADWNQRDSLSPVFTMRQECKFDVIFHAHKENRTLH